MYLGLKIQYHNSISVELVITIFIIYSPLNLPLQKDVALKVQYQLMPRACETIVQVESDHIWRVLH